MHFATLCSGSSGNSIVVGEGKRSFLIDCGVSGKALLQNLKMVGIGPDQIEGIIVTHEHIDHIKGVGIAARKLKVPIYTTPGIWEEIEQGAGVLAPAQRKEIGRSFECAGLQVDLFATSHDSRESYGLKIAGTAGHRPLTVGVATDTGIVTEEMNLYLKGCDGLVVEANHDHDALWQGSYPWPLKKRIAGIYGHLENKQLAEGLLEWLQSNTQQVVLAHLSAENNTPELALNSVAKILRDQGITKKYPQVHYRVAPRYQPHRLIILNDE